jgi:fused signal recognition particle receptor
LASDVGVKTTATILDALKAEASAGKLSREEDVWKTLTTLATGLLAVHGRSFGDHASSPLVILVIGVNGVGKTTTIGKLASRYRRQGKRVLLAAGDTFRAAAVLQLEVWGRRVDCPVVKGKDGADPGSVIFDAIKRAQAESIDVVIADTAGRLHTKVPLMDELKKVARTVAKALDRPADEVLLVLDATTGQNAVQQAHMFRETMEITGIALTKLDGTAKGGVVLGIANEHQVPVRFVGLGEKVEDLREFDPTVFAEALFSRPDEMSDS